MALKSLPQHGLQVLSDHGAGRVFLTLVDDLAYLPLAESVALHVSKKARAVTVASAPVTAASWESLSESLEHLIEQLGVRQFSVMGLGAGATLAQNLALSNPKSVRILSVVDASSRPHPSLWERMVDRIEAKLPFGLPLRLGSRGFNIKSYVHRLRCPLLVVGTSRASKFIRHELESLAALAPTAWKVMLNEPDFEREAVSLTSTLLAFYDTPAKCPQKNLGVAV